MRKTHLNEVKTGSLVSLVSLRSFECYAHSDLSQKTLQHLCQLNHSEFYSTFSSLLSSDAAPRILISKFSSVPSTNVISMMTNVWWIIFELFLIDLCLSISMDSKSTNSTLKLGEYTFCMLSKENLNFWYWILWIRSPKRWYAFVTNIVNMRTKFQRTVYLNPKISRGMEIFDGMSV